MPLRSMTGFARTDGTSGAVRFHWELRSVNGRGLDVRLRLPPGYEGLEAPTRDTIAKSIVRGNVSATLTIDAGGGGGDVRVNERALATVLAAIERLAGRGEFEPARPEGVLALRGVLELAETGVSDSEAVKARLLASLAEAVEGLVGARAMEGQRLEQVLAGHVEAIESLVERIAGLPSRHPDAIRRRLAEQIQRLLGTGASFDPDRLHQEAVLAATRADVEEEIKRLTAHVAAARALLADRAPAGRRLDFLSQELNREANTICAKSSDIDMTRLGLDLKAVVDQLREQVQNIE